MSQQPVSRRQAPRPAPDELPDKAAAVIRAIQAGNYGPVAKSVVAAEEWREREPAGRYIGRLRMRLYDLQADKAGDALSVAPVMGEHLIAEHKRGR